VPRVVAHLWIPGFYSEAEAVLCKHPKDAPLVVIKNRQVMDASRGARSKGIRPGMPLRQARLACPDLIEVGYVPERYADLADGIWTVCADYSPAVEPRGQHEAFIDFTSCSDVPDALERISRDIEGVLGIRPAFGVAGSKLVSRIASGILPQMRSSPWSSPRRKTHDAFCNRQVSVSRPEKPGGTLSGSPSQKLAGGLIVAGSERDFLSPMPVTVLWTLGDDIISSLLRLGVKTVGEIQAMARSELTSVFGRAGYAIYEYSLGVDRSSVLPVYPKTTATFRKVFDGEVACEAVLMEAVREGASFIDEELTTRSMVARKWGLVLELAHAGRVVCERRPAKSPRLHGGARAVYQNLLKEELAQRKLCGPVEAISLIATDLIPVVTPSQVNMFEAHVATDSTRAVATVVSRVRDKFGPKSLFRASLLEWDRRDSILLTWEAWNHHEEGKQVASGRGTRGSTSREVLLETEMASGTFHY